MNILTKQILSVFGFLALGTVITAAYYPVKTLNPVGESRPWVCGFNGSTPTVAITGVLGTQEGAMVLVRNDGATIVSNNMVCFTGLTE